MPGHRGATGPRSGPAGGLASVPAYNRRTSATHLVSSSAVQTPTRTPTTCSTSATGDLRPQRGIQESAVGTRATWSRTYTEDCSRRPVTSTLPGCRRTLSLGKLQRPLLRRRPQPGLPAELRHLADQLALLVPAPGARRAPGVGRAQQHRPGHRDPRRCHPEPADFVVPRTAHPAIPTRCWHDTQRRTTVIAADPGLPVARVRARRAASDSLIMILAGFCRIDSIHAAAVMAQVGDVRHWAPARKNGPRVRTRSGRKNSGPFPQSRRVAAVAAGVRSAGQVGVLQA